MKYDVFISYRREGGDKYARTIQQALEKQYRVFLDFDELKDGVFDQRIIDAISESPVFLLILSRGALDRCVNENDWVRQEILQAVKCGCHIVPVTIDDTFEGLPASLPEELRRAVGQHQFSELQMKTLFKASMEQLVHDRIAPYVHREENTTGIEVHIDVDADCDLFRFKTFIRHLKADIDNTIHMNPGKYKLDFISTQIPEVKDSIIYSIAPELSCDIIEIKLKDKISEAIKKIKKEEEAKRKAEEAKQKSEEVRQRQENTKLKPVEIGMLWGFSDKSGKVIIPGLWDYAREFHEGLANVEWCLKRGYIDETGKLIIACQWNDDPLGGRFRSNGVAFGQDENWETWFFDKDGKPDQQGRKKGPYFDGLAPDFSYGDKKWGFIDKCGKIAIQHQWDYAFPFHKGLARVKDSNGKWGVVDKTGNVVIPCEWGYIGPFNHGIAWVKNEKGKFGYIHASGHITVSCQWEDVGWVDTMHDRFSVKDSNGKWWIITHKGKVIGEL